jgi:hypothetical protein
MTKSKSNATSGRANRRASGGLGPRRLPTAAAALAVAFGAVLSQAVWATPALAGGTVGAAASSAYPSPTKAAKDLAHQQYLQQQRAAHSAAAAAKAAAEFARAARVGRAIWDSHGRPATLTVVGPTRVYVLRDGVLQLNLTRPSGPLSVLWLAQNLPDQWASWPAAGVARLNSAVVVTDGSSLTAGSRQLSTLQLTDGASIWVGRGSLAATGITITSIAPATGKPLPSTDPARPFVLAGRGATLTLDNVTVTGLGNSAAPDHAGVTWGKGATGHAAAVKVTGGYAGLRLAASVAVTLRQVTVTGSAKDGLVLVNDTGTTLDSVVSEENGGNGLRLGQGPANRTVAGVTTSGNTGFGIAAGNISGLTIDRLGSSGDTAGGIELTGCAGCTVTAATTTNDHVGVKVSRASSQVKIVGGTFSGGAYGVFVGAQSTGVTLSGITVQGAASYGVDVSGRDVTVAGGKIASAGTGVRIGPGSDTVAVNAAAVSGGSRAGVAIAGSNVTVKRTTVQGGHDGIQVYLNAHTVELDSDTVTNARDAIVVAKGAAAVRILNPVLIGFAGNAISNSSAGLAVTNGRLHGGGTAVATVAPMSLTGTQIDQVTEGMHIGPRVTVNAGRISILAEKTGVSIAPGGRLELADSKVLAPIGIKGDVRYSGTNVIALPPFPWLGVVAIAAVLLGFILEALHATRQPKRRPTREVAPEHVVNVA